MAIITKITAQKQSVERYNVYLDDGKGEKFAFSVDQDVLIRFNLQKGKQLDEFDLLEIQYGDEAKKAYNKAIEYLSYRMRSEREVQAFLKKKNYNHSIIQEVCYKLIENKYLDDLEFAKAFVRTQRNSGGKGPDVIKRELVQKGITAEFIEEALEQYDQQAQVQKAITHAEKVISKGEKISTIQLRQKVEQHLMRKGFPYEVIAIALNEVNYEQDQSIEWDALVLQGEKAKRKYGKEDPYQFKMKVKQFLYRKGFALENIEKYLDEE